MTDSHAKITQIMVDRINEGATPEEAALAALDDAITAYEKAKRGES